MIEQSPILPDENGQSPWSSYRRLVLRELERLAKELDQVHAKLDRFLLVMWAAFLAAFFSLLSEFIRVLTGPH